MRAIATLVTMTLILIQRKTTERPCIPPIYFALPALNRERHPCCVIKGYFENPRRVLTKFVVKSPLDILSYELDKWLGIMQGLYQQSLMHALRQPKHKLCPDTVSQSFAFHASIPPFCCAHNVQSMTLVFVTSNNSMQFTSKEYALFP